jgi:hypothetical protein
VNLAIAVLVALAVVTQAVVFVVLSRLDHSHHGVPWERRAQLPGARTGKARR